MNESQNYAKGYPVSSFDDITYKCMLISPQMRMNLFLHLKQVYCLECGLKLAQDGVCLCRTNYYCWDCGQEIEMGEECPQCNLHAKKETASVDELTI